LRSGRSSGLCHRGCSRAIVVGKGSNVGLVLDDNGEDFTERDILGTIRVKNSCDETLFLQLVINDSFISLNTD
jgi:restriction endonuclease S subunit